MSCSSPLHPLQPSSIVPVSIPSPPPRPSPAQGAPLGSLMRRNLRCRARVVMAILYRTLLASPVLPPALLVPLLLSLVAPVLLLDVVSAHEFVSLTSMDASKESLLHWYSSPLVLMLLRQFVGLLPLRLDDELEY